MGLIMGLSDAVDASTTFRLLIRRGWVIEPWFVPFLENVLLHWREKGAVSQILLTMRTNESHKAQMKSTQQMVHFCEVPLQFSDALRQFVKFDVQDHDEGDVKE